eukprot:g4253.t1
MSWMNQSASYSSEAGGVIAKSITPYQKLEDYPHIKTLKDFSVLLHEKSPAAWETNRDQFEGEGGIQAPDAILNGGLQNGEATYETPIAALEYQVQLTAGGSEAFRFVFAPTRNLEEALTLREKYLGDQGFEKAQREVEAFLEQSRGCISINTPDQDLDNFVNHWLNRQVFYHGDANRLTTDPQTRNFLQDAMGMAYIEPGHTRSAILKTLSQQKSDGCLPEGVVLSNGGELKYINQIPHTDHCVWLPILLQAYLDETNDYGLLEEMVECDNQSQPVLERVTNAMHWLIKNRDHRNLSYIAQGDWCDPLNMVGHQGKGVSGWLTIATVYALNVWAGVAKVAKRDEISTQMQTAAKEFTVAAQEHLWDGDWFARGISDNGTRLGVHTDEEGKIWLNPQSWALMSDNAWAAADWRALDQLMLGEMPSAEDFSGRYKLLWTPEYLYLLAEITDDILIDAHANPLNFYWEDDMLEILIDEDASGGIHTEDYNAFAYHMALDNQIVDIGPKDGVVEPRFFPNHATSAWRRDAESDHKIYWEARIAVHDDTHVYGDDESSRVMLSAGKTIGLMVAYCDADDTSGRQHFLGHEKNASDYFLAGRNLPWWAIGASLIAANISAEQIIGMSGSAWVMGIAIAAYEWMAAITLIIVGKWLLPVFLKHEIYTMPQFLEQRFDHRVRNVMAIFWLIVYVFVNLTAILWLGALAVNTVTGVELTTALIALGAFATAYSIYGGLKAVALTDIIQVVLLVFGGILIAIISLNEVSGGQGTIAGFQILTERLPEKFDLIFTKDSPHYAALPGISVLVGGMWIMNLSYWGFNQYIIQRALAAKSTQEAQKGILFAAFLKMLMPLIIVLPGVAAVILAPELDAPDRAYPTVMNLLPAGILGLVFAALIAAIVSSLASMMNSISTIFTMDIYRHLGNKDHSEKQLVKIGRIVSLTAMVIAMIVARPLLGKFDQAFQYIQEFTGFFTPGVHPDHKAMTDRYQGYLDGMAEVNLNVDESMVIQGENTFDSGIDCGVHLLRQNPRPTAIFCANDNMATGVMKVAHERRLQIPGDISIAGFDDLSIAAQVWPQLTTVRQPLADMAKRINPVDRYDPVSKRWQALSSPPLELHHFQAVSLGDAIYILGAMTGEWPNEVPVDRVIKYYPDQDRFEFTHLIPESRRRGGAGAAVHNGKIYLLGGITNGHQGGYQPWLDEYDPTTGEWNVLPDAPNARDHFQAVVVGEQLYAFAGRRTSHATDEAISLTSEYGNVFNLRTQAWLPVTQNLKIPTARAGNMAIDWGDHIILAGGESDTQESAHNEVEVFNTKTETWHRWPSLNLGRHGSGLAILGDHLYTLSGSGKAGGEPELLSLEHIELTPGLNTDVTPIKKTEQPALAEKTALPVFMRWHTLNLTFGGPNTSENASENPFTDYRLSVTFSHQDSHYQIRGFYAADGDAANSGADSGNLWQVRFTPDQTGEWHYSAELRKGKDIALSDEADIGETVPLENSQGRFIVTNSDKTGSDFRGKGRLIADNGYFRFLHSDRYWLKGGTNSPENFLGYIEFDDTYVAETSAREGEAVRDGNIHRYTPHIDDWQPGDPTWGEGGIDSERAGRGKGIIGAINYLGSTGMNAAYFLTFNLTGDGNDVWPYVSTDNFERFDVSKLDQWEVDERTRVNHEIAEWRRLSREADNEWLITMDEIGKWHTGAQLDSEDPNHDTLRQHALWGAILGGAAGVEWYFGAHSAANDLSSEDWRLRDRLWNITRLALEFFEDRPFWTYSPCNELIDSEYTGSIHSWNGYCAGHADQEYVIYLPADATPVFDASELNGAYRIQWFDPVNASQGGELQQGSIVSIEGGEDRESRTIQSLGEPPENASQDWVILLSRVSGLSR